MKKIILLLAVFLILGSSTVVGAATVIKPDETIIAGGSQIAVGDKADMSDYKNFEDTDHRFLKGSMEQVLKLFSEGGSGIIYFGYSKCPWCIEAVPILNELAKQEDQDIYYVQTRDNKKKLVYKQSEKRKLISYADKFMRKDTETDQYELFVPFVLAIKDGKSVAGHIGTAETYDPSQRTMNSKEIKKVTDKYKTILNAID